MRRQRGGFFWPFTSSDEEGKNQEEPMMEEEEKEPEEKGEAGGIFSGWFGTSTRPSNTASAPADVPEIDMEPTGKSLTEGMQAGGAKKRKHRTIRKHRKSHKSRKSHKKLRTHKSMKSKKH